MKIGIISDTHIGKNLRTNTTMESRQRLKDNIQQAAHSGIDVLEQSGCDIIIHTADLFDKAINDEADILAGSEVAKRCDVVMFGNHDDRNRKDTVSSIGLLAAVEPNTSNSTKFVKSCWEANVMVDVRKGVSLYYIPHCVSQQVFEESLNLIISNSRRSDKNVLFLHCNYDNGLVTDKEQNLNLTEDMADTLLEYFDFIVMGHEHQLSKRKDGRVISVGSTHPTSLSDISDKFATVIDTDTSKVEHHLTWDSSSSWAVDVADFINPTFLTNIANNKVQFIDVVGKASTEMSVAVNDRVSEVWSSSETLIALRTSKIEYASEASTAEEEISLESLPETMLSELEGAAHDLLAEALSAVDQQ